MLRTQQNRGIRCTELICYPNGVKLYILTGHDRSAPVLYFRRRYLLLIVIKAIQNRRINVDWRVRGKRPSCKQPLVLWPLILISVKRIRLTVKPYALLDESIRIGVKPVRVKYQPTVLLVEPVYRIDKLELDDLLVRAETREIEYIVVFSLCRRHKHGWRDI